MSTYALPASIAEETADVAQFVTVRIGSQLIGMPIAQVRDVFQAHVVTSVPHAPASVSGLVNLRGRIVLVFSLAEMLGLASAPPSGPRMVVSIESRGETFGVLVDAVGGVIAVPLATGEPLPPNLTGQWARHARRIYKLESELMIEIDAVMLLDLPLNQAA